MFLRHYRNDNNIRFHYKKLTMKSRNTQIMYIDDEEDRKYIIETQETINVIFSNADNKTGLKGNTAFKIPFANSVF